MSAVFRAHDEVALARMRIGRSGHLSRPRSRAPAPPLPCDAATVPVRRARGSPVARPYIGGGEPRLTRRTRSIRSIHPRQFIATSSVDASRPGQRPLGGNIRSRGARGPGVPDSASPTRDEAGRDANRCMLPCVSDLITDFYRQNEWANLRLIEVCRGLTDEQLDATAPGAYGSIRSTLTHLIGAEALNVRRLGVTPAREVASRDAAWPGFDMLVEVAQASADALIERARAVGGTTIIVEFGRARAQIEADVLLVQALNHSTDHRSQICTILTVIGALPETGDDGQTIVDAWAWSGAMGLARRVE